MFILHVVVIEELPVFNGVSGLNLYAYIQLNDTCIAIQNSLCF